MHPAPTGGHQVAGPPLAFVEGANQYEQIAGGGLDAGRQLCDVVAEAFGRRAALEDRAGTLYGEPDGGCPDRTCHARNRSTQFTRALVRQSGSGRRSADRSGHQRPQLRRKIEAERSPPAGVRHLAPRLLQDPDHLLVVVLRRERPEVMGEEDVTDDVFE